MSFQLNIPPSMVVKIAKVTDSQEGEDGAEEAGVTQKKREDWRKLKELEEARKAGTAPAMKDEEGRDINPHIPQYIMQAPWYHGSNVPTLRHQRFPDEMKKNVSTLGSWFKKGVKEGAVATKFRKGSCENCGSMTHKKKDCVERPRKIGARFTGDDIAPDEHIQPDLAFDFDGKRDRWNGYDTAEHKRIVDEYQKIDEAKRQLKANRLEEAVGRGELAPEEAEKAAQDEEEDDEDKYADDVDMPGQKFESKQRITVRNLRIREDTAKYLYNLDVSSAYYDPKTRSMRENPFESTGKKESDIPYAGDNFVRWSGDAMQMAEKQLFSWEAYEKGAEAHLQADPTKLDILTKEYLKKKADYKTNLQDSILQKYGGEEHLEAPPKQLLMAQSEEYVEYSRHGTVIKGQEKAKVKSRYEEDVYNNNHTSVWGSFWKQGRWGYNCCHSFVKESYCTGKAGKEAEMESLPPMDEPSTSSSGDHHRLQIESSAPSTHHHHHHKAKEPSTAPSGEPGSAPSSAPSGEPGSAPSSAPSEPSATSSSDHPSPQEPGASASLDRLEAPDTSATLDRLEAPGTAAARLLLKDSKRRPEIMLSEALIPSRPTEEDLLMMEKVLNAEKKRRKKKEKKRKRKQKKKRRKRGESSGSSGDSSSDDSSEDEEAAKERKIKEAIRKEEARVKEVDRILAMDERKRPYNVTYDLKEPSEVDMEAFHRKQLRDDDPMAQFLS